jgi:transposase InsO family protein
MAECCEAPTFVVLETQPPSRKTDLQHAILFAKKRDHVLVFTLAPSAQSLPRRIGTETRSEVYFRGGRSSVGHYGVDHRTTKIRSPRTNGFVERLNRTRLDECFRVAGRQIWYLTVEELQQDLDRFLTTTIGGARTRAIA